MCSVPLVLNGDGIDSVDGLFNSDRDAAAKHNCSASQMAVPSCGVKYRGILFQPELCTR